jgi:hypothetical protein
MNIRAGLQFQSKNPKSAPARTHCPEANIKTAPQLATNPSRPSMKLKKLMIAVTASNTKGKLHQGKDKEAMAMRANAVQSWAR